MSNLPSLLLQGSSSINTCRADNPISSLSKTLQDDRSIQRDRFQCTSSSAFTSVENNLRHPNQSTSHLINLQLNQEQPQHSSQPFDSVDHLSQKFNRIQIGRTPLSQQATNHNHNWSSAFLKSTPIHHLLQSNHSPFPSTSSTPNQWQSEFLASRQHQSDHQLVQKSDPSFAHQPIFQSSLIPPQSNLSSFHYPHPSIQRHLVSQAPAVNHLNSSQTQNEWDAAYSKHDHDLPSSIADLAPLEKDQGYDQAPHEYVPRSHSPIRSSSPDALARTAASLITTVENGQQFQNSNRLVSQSIDHESAIVVDPSTTDKFNQSSFMDFMRKLRDGEVKVEGDKVVQQLDPVSRSTPTIDHQTQVRQSMDNNIQQLSGFIPMTDSHSFSVLGNSARANLQLADSNENPVLSEDSLVSKLHPPNQVLKAFRDDLESRMNEMNEMMNEADAELERTQHRAQMNRFQGDGGAVSELEDILNAASEVGRPEKQSWTNTHVPGATEAWVEDFDQAQARTGGSSDAKEQQPEFDEMGMFGRPLTQREVELERLKRMQRLPSSQELEWEALQHNWEENFAQGQHANIVAPEAISATSPAVHLERMEVLEAETGYKFQHANPLIFQSHRTNHHSIHETWQDSIIGELQSNPSDSILQKEKEVLNDPESASAWYSLGIKQQENEREDLAIQALRQAIKLDPELSDAILALAISYSNENRRAEALEEIERWIQAEISKVPHYRRVLNLTSHQTSSATQRLELAEEAERLKLRHERLTNQLLELARLGGRVPDTASVDPDVQIALGVLFNSNDEFQKACDCFGTALAVRPHDPFLFNRLGATLANSGKPEEAIEYYHKAIELLPTYIRARYNLSISLINLGRYSESVENILAALAIQEQESSISLDPASHGTVGIDHEASGVTSAVLWQTLEVNCSLLRNRFSPDTRKALGDCFSKKDFKSTHQILSEYIGLRQ